jgi:putative ABC transport system ATP-binding protein
MLEIDNVTRSYGTGSATVDALGGVSLRVNDGEFMAITGPSGSGKSTLLNIIGGLDRPSSGTVALDGVRIDNIDEADLVAIRRGKIAHVFQQYHLLPSLSAVENVLLPLIFREADGDIGQAMEALDRVGLSGRASHKPGELSGGEQQRVAIARSLVSNPSLILADEPTGNLDQEAGMEILGLFDNLHRDGRTVLIVTHEPEVARRTGGIISLRDGLIVDQTRF